MGRVLLLAFVLIFAAPVAVAAEGCRGGDPLANIWEPSRLKVEKRCQAASGVVVKTERSDDGDEKIWLRPDRESQHLLNSKNPKGRLILEIVPVDQPGCRKGERVPYGRCAGAHVRTPRPGARITAIGPHVLDTNHGWMEIHPVWRIRN